MPRILSQYAGMKREIYILVAGRLVTAMGSFVWPILTFFLTARLGLSDSLATLLMATATVLSLPAAMLGGKLADRFSRKRLIIIFDLVTVSLYTLAAFLPTSFLTAGLVFVAGLAQTCEHPAYSALCADFSDSEQRSRAYSLSYLGYNLGFILGASVAGILFQHYLWLSFLLNAGAILTSTVLIALFIDMRNVVAGEQTDTQQILSEYEQPVSADKSMWQVLRERPVVLLTLLAICMSAFPGNAIGILLPLQLKASLGDYGAAIYGYLNSLNGFIVILLTPVMTVLLRRLTEIPKSALGMVFFILGMALFSMDAAIWLLYLGMTVFTMGEVISTLGNEPYSSRRVPASHWGRIGGIRNVGWSLAGALTQYVTSLCLLLGHNNYRLVWYLFVVVSGLDCIGFWILYRFDRKTFPLLYHAEAPDGAGEREEEK